MSLIFAYPGTGLFAQEIALALHEADTLEVFATTFAWNRSGPRADLIRSLPFIGGRLSRQLDRRAITEVPWSMVRTHAFWEMVRTALHVAHAPDALVDQVWEHLSLDFTRWVGRQLTAQSSGLYAYEYTALDAFQAAKDKGLPCILDLPSMSNHHYRALLAQEHEAFPELADQSKTYMTKRFPARQQRRDQELASADIIFTNSRLTAQSHINAGVSADKVYSLPLAAPAPIDEAYRTDADPNRPLRLAWAGTFSIRKGAHYLVDAMKDMRGAIVDVYGAWDMPRTFEQNLPDNIRLKGSCPQAEVFKAFEEADALLFPTLSDGFGMVIPEALSRGLPVITTNQAGAAELIEQERNGLVIEAGNAAAIRTAISWCLDNRLALAEMRDAALVTARNWQWSHYRKAFRDMLGTALSEKGFRTAATPLLQGSAQC